MDYKAINISIHAAREGGDYCPYCGYSMKVISIHAAREGGDGLGCGQRAGVQISIHAAREGGDHRHNAVVTAKSYFNPRRP